MAHVHRYFSLLYNIHIFHIHLVVEYSNQTINGVKNFDVGSKKDTQIHVGGGA